MGKYIISNDEFQIYYSMLKAKDALMVKDGVQKLSDAFAAGRHILKPNSGQLCNMLLQLLNDPAYAGIYKWIYKCVCFYNNAAIEDLCIKKFPLTDDMETRNWIISAISSGYDSYDSFMDVIHKLRKMELTDAQRESLENKNIFYSASLFGHFDMPYDVKNIEDDILRNHDKNGMFWMAKCSAYSGLSHKKGLDQIVHPENLDELTYSDDAQVQCYAYWGRVYHTDGYLDLKDEENKRNVKADDSLKWYYTGTIAGGYRGHAYDFIEETLKSACGHYKNNIRAKEGILQGMGEIPYENRFDGLLIDWYCEEQDMRIRLKLLEYMIKNVRYNRRSEESYPGSGSFFEIIENEVQNSELLLKYILDYNRIYKTLTYVKKSNRIEYNEEQKNMSTNSISGGNFWGPVIVGNKGSISEYRREDMDAFLDNLKSFSKLCNRPELAEESKTLYEKINSKEPDIKDKVLSFSGNLANFVTIASATPQAIEIAKQLMQYIASIF